MIGWRRVLGALLVFLVVQGAARPAAAACQFATAGDGMRVTVAARSGEGETLRVDWGDGSRSRTLRPVGRGLDRVFLRHTYAAAGSYELTIETLDGGASTCRLRFAIEVPYANDGEASGILPEAEAPESSDDLPVTDPDAASSPEPTAPAGGSAGRATGRGRLPEFVDWLLGRIFGG